MPASFKVVTPSRAVLIPMKFDLDLPTPVVNLQAGHCPHDEAPEQFNGALLEWLASLDAGKPADQPEPALQSV